MEPPQQIQSRDLRGMLTAVLDSIFHHGKQVVVTRNRKPIAAIIHPDDLVLLNRVKARGITLAVLEETP